jgi:error-prone DNA polymerase
MYVELHCHSAFSFLDGASNPEELVAAALALGYDSLALTDHNNMAGAMEFARAANACGVRPITGAEVTLHGGAHLTLLAETPRGYGNISRLISHAHMNSPRGQPALIQEELDDRTEGVIALSGCRDGEIARLVEIGDIDAACKKAARYTALFGARNFYIELQENLVYGDRARNRGLVDVARRSGLPVVATNNVHYHERARHRLQDVLVAIRHRTTLDASERLRRRNADFYLKSPAQMAALFAEIPEAISNTRGIAERCRFDVTRDLTYCFPDYEAPDGQTADEYLEKICLESASELYGAAAASVQERLRDELRVIRDSAQAGFFLRNWAIMRHARDNNLPARGRGSSVGSLVCYLLGLSGIDPIKYNLFAGRFLNEARRKEDVPDIDIDFARDARAAMFQHVFDTYGTERSAMVANVIQYRYPMAVREAGKAMGLPEDTLDKLAKRMRGRFRRSLIEEMQEVPELRGVLDTPLWREFVRLVQELKGKPRHLGQHSGGIIISDTPIVEQVPVQPSAMDGRYICQWDKDSVADAGFVKMDFLGYPSLGHLYRALALIGDQRSGAPIDPGHIPLDDPEVYAMIQRGDILGIVQIQSRAQLQAILRLKIASIEDLVVQVALIRPGPIQGGAVNPYIARCQGKEEVTYDHPCLEPILGDTKGVIIFQEQCLQVAMAVAGFTAGQAESLRRAMSRKRSREEMRRLREEFLQGACEQGLVDEETAVAIYEKIASFAAFGFPKSHAAAMAETAGKLAWVKRYHPLEFYCAWLNEWPFGFYSPGVIVNEARRNAIDVRSVDVNRSRGACIIENGTIRLGYNYVRGIGEVTRTRLDNEFQNGPYCSLWDFWRRTRIERAPIERLISLGAFAWTGLHERELLWQLGLFYEPLGAQLPLALLHTADMIELPEMSGRERILEDLRFTEGAITLRGHIMDLALASIHERATPSFMLERLEQGTAVVVAGFVAVRQAPETAKGFVFHTLEDHYGLMNIITKPHLVQRYRRDIEHASALIVHGHIEREERTINVVSERLEELPLYGGGMVRSASHDW